MIRLIIMVAMLAGLPGGGGAAAQTTCGTHASMIASLDMKYSETRRGGGLAGPSAVFEIWASDNPPFTWTILKVMPNGMACVMAVGEDWQTDPPVAPGELL